MTQLVHFPDASAAAMSIPYAWRRAGIHEVLAKAQPSLGDPYGVSLILLLNQGDLEWASRYSALFEASGAVAKPISITLRTDGMPPAALVHELRRISGLTWEQIAGIFDVTMRSVFGWASGNSPNAENHRKLALAVSAIRFIDRGASSENCDLLLSEVVPGRTCLDLFSTGAFDMVKELVGEGPGRPSFDQALTADAKKFNTPGHFGKSMESAFGCDDSEILPIRNPRIRRAKARRMQA